MRIAIIGGTGRLGRALAPRLARGGAEVAIVGRDPSMVRSTVEELSHIWSIDGLCVASVEQLDDFDVVILAVPAPAIVALSPVLGALRPLTVLSALNDLSFVNSEFVSESVACRIHRIAPQVHVATAFNHLPAKFAADPAAVLDADVLVAASSTRAVSDACAVVALVDGLHAVHVGSLELAYVVEAFTALLINVNNRQRSVTSLRLVNQRLVNQLQARGAHDR